jgi:hypothetical protein
MEPEPKQNHLWIDFLLVAVVLAALYLATARIGSSVRESADFRFVPDIVDASSEGLSEPLSSNAEDSIKRVLTRVGDFNSLNSGDISRIRYALLSSPWVKSVQQVKMSITGAVSFSVEVRNPVAWVLLQGKGWHLCDSDGVRLPVSLPVSSDYTPSLPVVCGVANRERVPRVGEKWGNIVLEGVSVAELLTSSQRRGRIPVLNWQVDISELVRPEGKVVIVSGDARRFEWGRSPLSPKIDLICSQEKLDNLAFLLKCEDVIGKRSYYLLWTVPTAGHRVKEDSPVPTTGQSEREMTGNPRRWREF